LRAQPKDPKHPRLGVHPLTVRIEGAGQTSSPAVLKTRLLFLPPGFKGLKQEKDWAIQDKDDRWYYTRIVKTPFPNGPEVEFVLIPCKPYKVWNADPVVEDRVSNLPAFYIMKHKVSLGLYRRFDPEPEQKGAGPEKRWRIEARGRPDNYPVLAVSWKEASSFAETCFGGKLPGLLQWDKAAGRFKPYADVKERPEGPYRGRWDDQPRPKVAVGLKSPRPIGAEVDDISPFGCRDMAGNGEELTRELLDAGRGRRLIVLRGRPYNADVKDGPGPFQFRFVEDPQWHGELGAEEEPPHPSSQAKPGFRVVIEVP
jgi:formylglycine-generating enzyme required for sulfatase activity